jgi:YHS domain-containing protein
MKKWRIIGTAVVSALAFGCSSAPQEQVQSASPPPAQTAASAEPHAGPHAAAQPAAQAEPAKKGLTRIDDPSTVCMVNDHFMGSPQIPVPVGDKTYYGCCEMCEGKLQADPSVRLGIDPVSKRPVDKALAVLAMDGTGKIFYFESEESLRAYSASL